jgi:hypothetical protein
MRTRKNTDGVSEEEEICGGRELFRNEKWGKFQ